MNSSRSGAGVVYSSRGGVGGSSQTIGGSCPHGWLRHVMCSSILFRSMSCRQQSAQVRCSRRMNSTVAARNEQEFGRDPANFGSELAMWGHRAELRAGDRKRARGTRSLTNNGGSGAPTQHHRRNHVSVSHACNAGGPQRHCVTSRAEGPLRTSGPRRRRPMHSGKRRWRPPLPGLALRPSRHGR